MSGCVDSHCFLMVEHLGGTGGGADNDGRGGGDNSIARSPYFDSFHKLGGWTLALTAAGLGILEEEEVVVCISVVAFVLTLTVEFPQSSLASPLLFLML